MRIELHSVSGAQPEPKPWKLGRHAGGESSSGAQRGVPRFEDTWPRKSRPLQRWGWASFCSAATPSSSSSSLQMIFYDSFYPPIISSHRRRGWSGFACQTPHWVICKTCGGVILLFIAYIPLCLRLAWMSKGMVPFDFFFIIILFYCSHCLRYDLA